MLLVICKTKQGGKTQQRVLRRKTFFRRTGQAETSGGLQGNVGQQAVETVPDAGMAFVEQIDKVRIFQRILSGIFPVESGYDMHQLLISNLFRYTDQRQRIVQNQIAKGEEKRLRNRRARVDNAAGLFVFGPGIRTIRLMLESGGVLKLVSNSGIEADMLDLEVECQHLKRDFSTFVLNYKQVSVTQEGLKIDSDGTGVEAK